MGRPRDEAPPGWVTIAQAASALGVGRQAITNRIHRGTIPYEVEMVNDQPRYRIRQEWLEAEVKSHALPATRGDTNERTAEIMAAFEAGIEVIRAEVERQHTQLVPLSEQAIKNQVKIMGTLAAMQTALNELFKEIRRAGARAEEEDRKEQQYQQNNLELGREVRDLQRQTLDLLTRVEQAEAEREERGQKERRSFWRRLFSP